MDHKLHAIIFLFTVLLLLFQSSLVVASSNAQENGLKFLKLENLPQKWKGLDPCDWEGLKCIDRNITSIKLSSMGLEGWLTEDIDRLSELQILDLSSNKGLTGKLPRSIGNLKKLKSFIVASCGFDGEIPSSVGSLKDLAVLSLNSNHFSGTIPPSIGHLSKLAWLDITDNEIEGPIPVSHGAAPGLDMLLHCRHMHFGMNKLTGPIPDRLFSANMSLIHVLLDRNKLIGTIPSTLGLVQTLEVLDLSNNHFEESAFPRWLTNLHSLQMLKMDGAHLQGTIPADFFSLPKLKTVRLKDNNLNGNLEINTSEKNHLKLIDLQDNLIVDFENSDELSSVQIILVGNTICTESVQNKPSYCNESLTRLTSSYVTARSCTPSPCDQPRKSSPKCVCAFPYTGTLFFTDPSLEDEQCTSFYKDLEKSIMKFFGDYSFPVDSVSLSNSTKSPTGSLVITLDIFPKGRDRFNRTEISNLGFALVNQTYNPTQDFGPFLFNGYPYVNYAGEEKPNRKSNIGLIEAAASVSALLVFLLLGGVYAFLQKRRAERTTEHSRTLSRISNRSNGRIPQLKVARLFSFNELKKYTNYFSTENEIGIGGFGKVYLGTLPSGGLVAIKRAKVESIQVVMEFTTEIELLSRLHHKNLVSLVGFCFEHREQMLIYEYVPNGSLKDCLSGKSGIRLDWTDRLKVALDTARGIAYLHEFADPPIIHRDIKSTNILLDDKLVAKVADFGLSKLMGDVGKDHTTTQVKGTVGYLDPEYYMTQQLTEKSDVYSFGVLMLELITGRKPIQMGKYIVREVQTSMDKTKDLYNLQRLLDPEIRSVAKLHGFERFVELAMRCVENAGVDRPTMSEVVKEIETILQIVDLNKNENSTITCTSYEGSDHPYEEESFVS